MRRAPQEAGRADRIGGTILAAISVLPATCCSGAGSYANGRQPGRDLPVLRKIAIMHHGFRVHPANLG